MTSDEHILVSLNTITFFGNMRQVRQLDNDEVVLYKAALSVLTAHLQLFNDGQYSVLNEEGRLHGGSG